MEGSRRRVLARALDIVGDRRTLARQIHARPIMIDSWLSGFSSIPEHIFLQTVDIVLGEAEKNEPRGLPVADDASSEQR